MKCKASLQHALLDTRMQNQELGCLTGLHTPAQGYNGLLHVAQDSFYRDLSAEEARNIGAFNFDCPSVRPVRASALHALRRRSDSG